MDRQAHLRDALHDHGKGIKEDLWTSMQSRLNVSINLALATKVDVPSSQIASSLSVTFTGDGRLFKGKDIHEA